MTTAEILRQVWQSEAMLMIAVLALIALTVIVWMYVDERWTFYPRKRQRQSFGERRYL